MIRREAGCLGYDGHFQRRPARKWNMRIGTWNIKTINGKEVELVEEIQKYRLEVLGVSELKKKGNGIVYMEKGYTLRYAGVNWGERAKQGVGIILSEEMDKRVATWEPVNSRIIGVRLDLERKITIIQVYAPTEDCDILEKEEFYVQLQRTIDKENEEDRQVILMGDFNGRTGNDGRRAHGSMGLYGGERVINENGKRLIEFCIENQLLQGNSFFQHKQIHKITYEAEGREAKSIIDYIIYSKEIRNAFMDVKVVRGAELGTDHRLLIAKTRFKKLTNKEKHKKIEKIKVKQLLDSENKKEYKELIEQKLNNFELTQDNEINNIWGRFKEIVIGTAVEVCGKVKMNTKWKRTNWWTEEVKMKVKEKKEAWKQYLRSKSIEDWTCYIQKRNDCKKEVRRAKQTSWENFGNNIEHNFNENRKQFWNIVKGLKGRFGKGVRAIRNEMKILITDRKDILEEWRKYYEKKFGEINEQNNLYENDEIMEEDELVITEGELHDAMKQIKIGKAAGIDEIAPEFIKFSGKNMTQALMKIFQRVCKDKIMPDEWKLNIIVPVFKKGDNKDCENYRAICLSSVIYKLYTRILEKKLRSIIENELEEEQAGFRPGRQTQEQLFTLRSIIGKTIEKRKDLYLAFLDLKAAFDSVPHKYLWEALANKKVPKNLIEAIQSVYDGTKGVVRIDGEISNIFSMKKGIKQGDSLSPLLFINFMDEIIKMCKRRTPRVHIGYWNMRPILLQVLAYADDIVLIADSVEKLQNCVIEWGEELERKGMKINIKKSKVMCITKEERIQNIIIKHRGEVLEQVDYYEYLGTIFTSDGRVDQEILNRKKKANAVYFQISKTIMGKKEVAIKTKMQLYNSVLVPTLLYGVETLPLQDKHLSKIQSSEMKYLRKAINKTRRDRIRNERIREEVKQRPLDKEIEERQLKWWGHVSRMMNDRKAKQALEVKVQGKRGKGRPRITWEDRMERIGNQRNKSVGEMRRMMRNRMEWKRWVESDR